MHTEEIILIRSKVRMQSEIFCWIIVILTSAVSEGDPCIIREARYISFMFLKLLKQISRFRKRSRHFVFLAISDAVGHGKRTGERIVLGGRGPGVFPQFTEGKCKGIRHGVKSIVAEIAIR